MYQNQNHLLFKAYGFANRWIACDSDIQNKIQDLNCTYTWSLELLYWNAAMRGLPLWFVLILNSSHKILCDSSIMIKKALNYTMNAVKKSELWHSSSGRKARPHIGAFLYKNSRDHGQKSLKKIGRFKTLKGNFEINGTLNPFEPVQNNFRSIERRWKNHKNLPQVDHFVLPNVRQYLHADPWNWRLIFWPFTEIQN